MGRSAPEAQHTRAVTQSARAPIDLRVAHVRWIGRHRWSVRTSKRSWPNDSRARRGSPPSMRMCRARRPFAAFASWPAALPLRSTNADGHVGAGAAASNVVGGAMLVREQVDHDAADEELVEDVAQRRSPPPGQHAEWRQGRTHLEAVVRHGIRETGGAEKAGEHDDRGGGSAAGAHRERRQSEMIPDHARVPATGGKRGRADERGIGRLRSLEMTSTDPEQSRRSPLGRRQRLDDGDPRRTERTPEPAGVGGPTWAAAAFGLAL